MHLVIGLWAQLAFSDADLRLYEGTHEWDLKDTVHIQSSDGSVFDYEFKKVCSPYTGCKAVRKNSDSEAKLANIGAQDLTELNAAISGIAEGGTPVSCPSTGDSKRLNQQDRFRVSMAGPGPSAFFFDSRCAV